MSTPVIQVPRDGLLQSTHDFHVNNVGEFLLPRTIVAFDELAKAGELWVATDDTGILATCYVTREDGAAEAEFGGVVVRTDRKGTGLGSAIGTVAIAAHFLQDASPLIAHVHVNNKDPIPLLTKRLGFTMRGDGLVTLSKAKLEADLGRAINMSADAQGNICGNTFDFSTKTLVEFADRLASNQLAKTAVHVENKYFTPNALPASTQILRTLVSAR